MPVNQIDSITLSKYVINRVNEMGYTVSHLKLQKLLYYLDAWHLVYFEVPLINDDFEAWVHGPVVRRVWDYYRDESVLHDDIRPEPLRFDIREFLNDEQLELIDDVLAEYGKRTAYYLECLTHDERPWRMARSGYAAGDRCNEIIAKSVMKDFYSSMVYDKEN